MFLIERMIGVTIYSVILLFVFQMIVSGKIKYKKMLNIYLVCLTIMACFYVPYKTADLYRIFEIIDLISNFKFYEFVQMFLVNTSSPLAYLIYWVFGRLGIARLLPGIVCFIVYSIIFYIIRIVAEKYEISEKSIALTVFFLMSTGSYIMVISNIRTMLALSLICYCYVRETVKKKFNILHVVLYFSAVLIHNLAVVVFVLRIVVFVFGKKKKLTDYLMTIAILSIVMAMTIRYGNYLLDSVAEKALTYIGGDSYSYIWDYISGSITLLIELYILRLYKKNEKKEIVLSEYRKYLSITIFIAIIFCAEFSIYHRLLTYFCPILIIPLFMYTINNLRTQIRAKYYLILSMSMMILLLSCVRGSMSSLKFFEL